jgi:uncharacterized RDD family membrane protein YckC
MCFRRTLAFIIDLLVAVVLSIVLYLGYALLFGKFAQNANLVIKFDFENWYSVVATLIYFGLATYFGNGQPLGKKLMKIRVVSLTHWISLWQSIERALGYGASILEAGFGFIQYFIHPNRRTVHDRIAETIVTDERL